MKRSLPYISIILLISGCASSQPIPGPDGGQAYLVKCGSAVIEHCYKEAAQRCPAGYVFLDKNYNSGGTMLMPMGDSYMAVNGPNKMLIRCK